MKGLKFDYPIQNALYVLGEGLFIFFSVLASSWILIGAEGFAFNFQLFLKILLITIICQTSLFFNDAYDLKVTYRLSEHGIRLLQALGGAAIILAGIYFLFPKAVIGKGIAMLSISIAIFSIAFCRFFYILVLNQGLFNKKVILLGSGDLAQKIVSEVNAKKDCGYSLAMIVPEVGQGQNFGVDASNVKLIESYDGLCEMAKAMKIKKIIVALMEKRRGFPLKELLKCRVTGIEILEGNSFYETLTGKLNVDNINPGWLIFSEGFIKSKAQRFIKRGVDLILSILLLILLSPILLVTALLIKIDSKGSVFFIQDRVGQNKKEYQLYKFRSMVSGAEKLSGPVWAKENDSRVTRVGRFIRKWRIDEFPQLWNVLKGEMSFVGPRPERAYFVSQLEKLIPYYNERFTVKPGVTGWAQVCYPYGASIEDAREKLNYDLFYIKNMTTLMDLMVVFLTVKTVLFGKGAR